jgi:hypothetical protein
MPEIIDVKIENFFGYAKLLMVIRRIKVINGWIIYRDTSLLIGQDKNISHINSTSEFVSDPNHEWKVNEKPNAP